MANNEQPTTQPDEPVVPENKGGSNLDPALTAPSSSPTVLGVLVAKTTNSRNSRWFLVLVILAMAGGLYSVTASLRGLWPFSSPEQEVISTPLPTATFTSPPDPTADWKTYRNEKYGFKAKYPPSATSEIVNPNQVFEVHDRYQENIYFLSVYAQPLKSGGVPCSEAAQNFTQPFKMMGSVEINGVKYDKCLITREIKNDQALHVSFNKNNYTWVLTATNYDKDQARAIIDRIISTFKFFEPSLSNNDSTCIQVITRARNPQTGEVKDFPTPCDVPKGWEVINLNAPYIIESRK